MTIRRYSRLAALALATLAAAPLLVPGDAQAAKVRAGTITVASPSRTCSPRPARTARSW